MNRLASKPEQIVEGLWLRWLDRLAPVQLAAGEDVVTPFWSPDSSEVPHRPHHLQECPFRPAIGLPSGVMNRILVLYDSHSGNTAKMAKLVTDGAMSIAQAKVRIRSGPSERQRPG